MTWFNRWLILPSCFFTDLLGYVVLGEVNEENLAPHRHTIGKWRDIVVIFSYNCEHSLMSHQNLRRLGVPFIPSLPPSLPSLLPSFLSPASFPSFFFPSFLSYCSSQQKGNFLDAPGSQGSGRRMPCGPGGGGALINLLLSYWCGCTSCNSQQC